MPSADDLYGQIQLVCQYFHTRVGLPLLRYETAEIRTHDETWEPWNDLPIRLHIGPGAPVGVGWSDLSALWIDEGAALPFLATGEGDQYRWVTNTMPDLEPLLGGVFRAAHLDLCELIWGGDTGGTGWLARLLLECDRGWLEVYNVLDENGYAVHAARPDGEWVRCA